MIDSGDEAEPKAIDSGDEGEPTPEAGMGCGWFEGSQELYSQIDSKYVVVRFILHSTYCYTRQSFL